MANANNVCRYLDMPIPHGSDNIFKFLRRGVGHERLRNPVLPLQEATPNIRIRTTLIVGYPGETEDEFKQLYDFIEEMKFDRLGIFTYSEEEGTLAEVLEDDVPTDVKHERKAELMDLQANISSEKNNAMVGATLTVLVDKSGDTVSVGRTEYDSPEIDNIVHIKASVPKGEFVQIKINSANEFELIGIPI